MRKLLLILLCLPMIGFGQDSNGEYKKSSHSIMLGLNTYFNTVYYDFDYMDRTAIGFDLSYSFSLALQSNWSYSPYITCNYISETITLIPATLQPASASSTGDLALSKNIQLKSQYYYFFIGQKFGHIHNEIFSSYIGASFRINTNYRTISLGSCLEVEERLSFNKTHFIFFNIRALLFERSYLKNSNLGGYFSVIEPTIGYGITF